MSTQTRDNLEGDIYELLCEATTALRWVDEIARTKPWRRHDPRIFRQRAETALLAVAHLEKELIPVPN